MPVRNNGSGARLAALEAYVGTPKEPSGMTLTARLEAQHQMLIALNENQSEANRRLTRLEERVTRLEERMTRVEERLDAVEGTLAMVLREVIAIKNMLRPPDDPDEGPSLNGSRLPVR